MLRRLLLALCLALSPAVANALALHWSSGATTVTFTAATRCTLFVSTSQGEGALPSEWRLLWTAANCTVRPIAISAGDPCAAGVGDVTGLADPVTRADSAATLSTAEFCTGVGQARSQARYVFDFPAGAAGKLKAVALDPSDEDSTRVLESNVATFNGGLAARFPAALLHAFSVHQSLQMRVTAVGAELEGSATVSATASDSVWDLPLQITERSSQRVVATGSVAAVMPACQVTVTSSTGSAEASLAPDSEPELLNPEAGACSAQYFEELIGPPPSPLGYAIQPKDFALTAGFVDAATNRLALHLFYIRHNYWYYQPPNNSSLWRPDLDEKNLGHAWTSDFISWHGPAAGDKTDTTQIKVRPGLFDGFHVWAPSIVHPPGPTFYMFYTGVGTNGGKNHQRIGVARSTDLNSWSQDSLPVLRASDVPWANSNPTAVYGGSQQLRDPFVMADPSKPGQWLMYFVTVDAATGSTERMAVGAARSADLIHWTALPLPFASTERTALGSTPTVVESPHLFKRRGQWWMAYTVNQDQVFFETRPVTSAPDTFATDTNPANWTGPVWLRSVTQGRPAELQYWHATEHLGEAPYEWLAAFDDNAISIDIKGLFPTDSAGVDSLLLDCPPKPPVAGLDDPRRKPSQLQLVVLRPSLGASAVGLRMELPWRTAARLAVYDLAGRRLTTLLDRDLPAGVTDAKWDGADDSGNRVPRGIYFVRLSCARGARVSKVVMLR